MNNSFEIPKKIIWLASYPKSGNTWFRAFLTALLNNSDQVDINELKNDGIFSSRNIFDTMTDLDSEYLADTDIRILLPEVFNQYAINCPASDRLFIKIHDAYIYNKIDKPIVPTEATHCAVYFVRNPLDVASSFANHNNQSVDKAIKTMNNSAGALGKPGKSGADISPQFSQLLMDWSSHVNSWTNDLPFPVLIIKYEDMLQDSMNTFNTAVKFIGINATETDIQKAIQVSSFDQLKANEQTRGFIEKLNAVTFFFRNGQAGSWKNELTSTQISMITRAHYKVMERLNYL